MKFPYFIYKDQNSLDFGLFIKEKNSYKGAARDVTYTSVPGRSGDLIIDNGRYKNVDIEYKLALLNNTKYQFSELSDKIKSWLLSETGYFPLWDSYNPKYFRLATYSNTVDIEQELYSLGSLNLTFNCKPYRYSFEGQKPVILTEASRLYNAEAFTSKPYIKITGAGNITLNINNKAYSFNNVDEYIEIDSEVMNAYKGVVSKNNIMSSVDFPTLNPGTNLISWIGNVNNLEIIPRWRCL